MILLGIERGGVVGLDDSLFHSITLIDLPGIEENHNLITSKH